MAKKQQKNKAEGRVPPHNTDAERSVLGSILIDPDAIVKIADIISPEAFYETAHQVIYLAMQALYEDRQPIDAVTLTDQLKKMKNLTKAGGTSGVAELSNAVSTSANIVHYAQLVANSYIKRRIISLSGELTELAFDPSKELTEIMDTAEQQVFSLSATRNQQAFIPIKDTLVESFERLDELQSSDDELRGEPTGFADLDNMLAGMQDSNLLILAARPGLGKTTFALNIAQHMSVNAKKRVGFFSLEMSREELVDRLLVAQADIDAWKLKTGRLNQQDFMKLSDAMGVLADANIFVDDTPGMSIYEMRTRARRLMTEHDINMLVVDYLQLAHGRTRDNRVQEVAEISQGLKNIARELKIPVLGLSQLNRAIESRTEKSPQLSDLRESGCVTGDTLVTLADTNKRVRIDQLINKDSFAIWSLNTETYQLERAEVSNAFSTGKKPVYTLKTAVGRKIRATANHKFLTIEGWKRLDELEVGECIALPRSLPTHSKQTMNTEELALLGHLIGDGCTLPRHSIQYTTKEKELGELVVDLAKQVFKKEVKPRIKKERSWYQVYLTSTRKHTHGVRSAISEWLHDLGVWGLRSHEKRIPEKVFGQPAASISTFLSHLWATDGCIAMRGGKKPYPAIYYATSSQQLANDIQSLLLRIGVMAILKRVPQGNKGRDQFHVKVSGAADIRRFVEKVAAVGERRSAELHKIEGWISSREGNTNRDIIPADIWELEIKPKMRQLGITQRQFCDLTDNARAGTMFSQNLGRDRALRFAKAIDSTSLRNLATSDVYWDTIESLEYDGKEEVYDLTVPGNENFIANDVIIHNSIEQDADVVMFLYRKDEDVREAITLKIAKHRNGSVGEIDLYFRGDRVKFFGMEKKQEGMSGASTGAGASAGA